AAQDWDAIYFRAGSVNSLLRHAIVKYGGYSFCWVGCNEAGAIDIATSSVTIANSEISDNNGGIRISSASPTITASTFLNNVAWGISMNGSSPEIRESIFRGNSAHGIECFGSSRPLIEGNTFDGNGNWAIYMDASSSGARILGNAYANGKPYNGIAGGALTADATWTKDKTYVVTGQVIVPQGVTLRIEPGAVVKFTSDQNWINGIEVQGTLIADGNLPGGGFEPIYFTSVNDNSIGGATGNGSPAAQDWDAIYFRAGSVNSLLRHAIVKYGGYSFCWVGCNEAGAIDIATSSVSIANSEISDNNGGIRIVSASPLITASSFLNNVGWGIWMSGSSPEIRESIFRGNSGNGIECLGSSRPLIEGNTFDGNGNWAIYMDASSSGARILGNAYANG
ncbi:MAG: right-handed parallel beta-helix repeat-containing protein, partial [Desulfobacterales bacterium]|nr:right-handed parallel beta-helix repeat-containing protein [Desulfobacterales bacterium]